MKRIRRRALRWVRTRGLAGERAAEERSNEAPERSALDACAEVALRGGEFVRIEEGAVMRADGGGEARFEPKRRGPFMAELDGFNIQVAVRIESYDDEGRERLVRYCARPCFALERLSVLRDGRVGYQVKYPRRRGTHRVMTPIAFLARLAALVPPPRYPLVRYHGVLAPHAKRRSVVVPQVLESAACDRQDKASAITGVPKRPETKESEQTTQQKRRQGTTAEKARREGRCEAAPAPASQRETRELSVDVLLTTSDGAAEHQRAPSSASTMLLQVEFGFVPEGISVQHLERLLGGLLLATSPRVAAGCASICRS